jgi:hypothetical protein
MFLFPSFKCGVVLSSFTTLPIVRLLGSLLSGNLRGSLRQGFLADQCVTLSSEHTAPLYVPQCSLTATENKLIMKSTARTNLLPQTAIVFEEWCLLGCYAVWLL